MVKKKICKYLFDELLMYLSDKYIIEIVIFNECNILIN